MSLRRLALFSVLLLLVAGTAAALNPVNVGVTSSNSYLTANNIESSQIIISVTDGTWKAIGGATIQLAVTQPWGLADATGVTNAGGVFVTTGSSASATKEEIARTVRLPRSRELSDRAFISVRLLIVMTYSLSTRLCSASSSHRFA